MRRPFGAFRGKAHPAEKMGAQPIVTTPLTCRSSLAATRIMAAIDDVNRALVTQSGPAGSRKRQDMSRSSEALY